MVAADVRLPRTENRVRITEIFRSLQGEALTAGLPTVFVRLTGCPLRCQYCDTAYAFHGGQGMDLDEVISQVSAHNTQHICVTGGEPLAQRACLPLLRALCDQGYSVSLETSGAIDISDVDVRVSRVVDIKTPGSGECDRNLWSNVDHLSPHDQVKFVVCDREDFDWAVEKTEALALAERCVVWVSPSFEQVDPKTLADWLLASGSPMRLQMQLHKALWGDEPGR
ncbi:MAG: 7-carboxy-7-deazaguanine synthase QueE [Pseudomonadota bacterium]